MLKKQWQWGTLFLMLPVVGQADISGRVFQDFNANGTFENGGSYNCLDPSDHKLYKFGKLYRARQVLRSLMTDRNTIDEHS